MIWFVLAIFALSAVAPLVHRYAGRFTGWVLATVPIAATIYFAAQVPTIAAGNPITEAYAWVPTLAVQFSFYLDGLSVLMAILVTGIGALIVIYAGGYMDHDPHANRFFCLLLLFMGSMLGLVLADNALTLFIFWELTSVSSYLLIGYHHNEEESRSSALQALLVTALGGQALLIGLVIIGLSTDIWSISALLAQPELFKAHDLYLPALLLVLAGAFTKSAQFPFHFWLPNAMAAPTPVSAYLHSATMVKAGVYLLARMSPILGGTDWWMWIVIPTGAITALIGAYLAIQDPDLKKMLAYTTISALGLLTLMLGIGTPLAIKGAIVFLVAHACYKGALFMIAGAIDHSTGSRSVDELGGLRRKMPILAAITILAAISLAGMIPAMSFIGKEFMLGAVFDVPGIAAPLLAGAIVLAGALFTAVALILAIRPFFGELRDTPEKPHEPALSLWLGPAILVGASWIMGIWTVPINASFIAPAVTSVFGETLVVHLGLWHGLNLPLVLSISAVALGIGIFFAWMPLRAAHQQLAYIWDRGPEWIYQKTVAGMYALAQWQTRTIQNGKLRYYMMIVLLTSIGLIGAALFRAGPPTIRFHGVPYPYEVGVAALIFLSGILAVMTESRLAAIAALGMAGYAVGLLFLLYGGPDLAMTQFLVETLAVILFALVLYRLPRFQSFKIGPSRLRDAAICIAVGVLMTAIIIAAEAVPLDFTVTDYYARMSVPEAHGRNIVNVILVDFRALDTLGEIAVLALAATGMFALLRLKLGGGKRR